MLPWRKKTALVITLSLNEPSKETRMNDKKILKAIIISMYVNIVHTLLYQTSYLHTYRYTEAFFEYPSNYLIRFFFSYPICKSYSRQYKTLVTLLIL